MLTFVCPTLFGLEGIVADELRFHGKLTDVQAENGRVLFTGDWRTMIWANLNLRCAERVLLRIGTFPAHTFEQLFDRVYDLPWADFIPQDGQFPVKGHSLNSDLHSVPTIQGMIKKAIAKKLSATGDGWLPETGARYQVQFAIMNNQVELFLDTSGAGLHKRGYRANANAAPLRETLAAAMVKTARWRGREDLLDPFCGSGTICIEAALIAHNRAPGLLRTFDAEKWTNIDKSLWKQAREQALSAIRTDVPMCIRGSDIDPECVELAIANARKAGVSSAIHFFQADARTLDYSNRTGVLFANPPYGERLMDLETARDLYMDIGRKAGRSPLKQYYLTSDVTFEQLFGYQADKRRKLYNGMIKCDLYMYFSAPENRKRARLLTQEENATMANRGRRSSHS